MNLHNIRFYDCFYGGSVMYVLLVLFLFFFPLVLYFSLTNLITLSLRYSHSTPLFLVAVFSVQFLYLSEEGCAITAETIICCEKFQDIN